MNLFNKIYNALCRNAVKKAPRIHKYKKALTAKVDNNCVIKQGVTLFCPSYKKYFYCDKISGEGFFFRYKPVTDKGKYPVIIYHHGNGLNRAGKNDIQMYEFSCLKKNLNKQKCHQIAIHLDVTCEYNTDEHSRALDGFINYIQNTYQNVDFDRIYLAGTSHGGYACVYEVLRNPEKYAAAVISMAYTYNEKFVPVEEIKTNSFVRVLTAEDYEIISQTPVFMSWATDDSAFITNSNEILLENLKKNNAKIKTKIYNKGGHTIASDFFKDDDWAKWLFPLSRNF